MNQCKIYLIGILIINVVYSCFGQEGKSEQDSTVAFVAGKNYQAGRVKRFLFGSHYRKEWHTEIEAPVFDLKKEQLDVVKKGGSRQTTNLRLKDSIDREFVLRSIDKTPALALPEDLRETFLADVLQDQTSTGHPYGALTIPILAEAAGVFHTNPVLVYIPEDSSFGEFKEYLANKPAIFEERPEGNMNDVEHFGNPDNVIGTDKMLKKRLNDHDKEIDEEQYAKTRLFDMWVGDWSRHEDQWRWGVFDKDPGKLYKPIPRDRDHVYFKFDGLLPNMVSKPWGKRHLVHFGPEIKEIKGLNWSARNLDRIILTSLSEKEWIAIAAAMQMALTDSVIEAAIKEMPEQAFKFSGNEIIANLKSRRNDLTKVASAYYKILAKEVNVYGSNKNELFEVNRCKDSTELRVYALNKEGEKKQLVYERIFTVKETKEVRIFGLEGDDEFKVLGKCKKGIKLRLIGGEGVDIFFDTSIVKIGPKKTTVYDTRDVNKLTVYKEAKDLRSDNPKDSIHSFRHNYNYNLTAPILYPEYNRDDGLFLGAGVIKRTYGFKKYPYKTFQRIGVNYSTRTKAFNFKYFGDFRQVIRHINLSIEGNVFGPKYVINFFGLGNETTWDNENIDFYRVKGRQVYLSPLLYKQINTTSIVGAGPFYEYFKVEKTPSRFLATQEAAVKEELFTGNHFTGLKVYSKLAYVDNLRYPTGGLKWNGELRGVKQISKDLKFLNVNSDIAYFFTPKFLKKSFTFATRIGGATNFGQFYFYQANSLGGTSNLRGYRRDRFQGRTSAYHNTELRIKVVKLQTYLSPIRLGIMGFFDYGRVWTDGESSNKIHYGYGPGLWIEVFNRYIFSGTYGFSEEDQFVNVQLGFLF